MRFFCTSSYTNSLFSINLGIFAVHVNVIEDRVYLTDRRRGQGRANMASPPIPSGGCCVALVCIIAMLWLEVPSSLATSTAPPQPQASAFTLQDQHRVTHRYQFPRPKISVLIFADYAGSSQLENWIRPIYDRYQDTIAIDGVAELSSVPKLIRGMVRIAFRKRITWPVMLDWAGTVSTDYHYQKGEANLFFIAPNGRILVKVIGAINDAKLQRVQSTIDRQLNLSQP